MRAQHINRVSNIVLRVLSLAAAFVVAIGYSQTPLDDEGTLAHLFQLSIVALVPAGFLFLVTADWTKPASTLRRLLMPTACVLLAFAALYYLEHAFYPAHYPWHPRSGMR